MIVGSALMHYSFKKIVDLLGIGRSRCTVPAVTDNRIDLVRWGKVLERPAIGQAGSFARRHGGHDGDGRSRSDGQDRRSRRRFGVHFHVDAAWGGPMLFSKHRGRLAGIERADSVTIDGHKQLYVPLGIGLVLFRDPDTARSIEQQARYTIRAGSGDLGRRSIEGSRPAMAL